MRDGAARVPWRGDDGFTLVEMLVVLALLAVVTTAAAFGFSSARPGRAVASTSAAVVGELTRAKNDAIRSGRERSVTFDVAARTVARAGGPARAVPEGMTIALSTARRPAAADAGLAAIAFLPDGRSTGGRIDIEMESVRRRVSVDWLTGAIRETRP